MLRDSLATALLLSCAISGAHAFAQLSFSPRQAAPLSNGSAIIAHGDFNNDGREDIVDSVYSEPSRNVAVLYLSTADGTYDAPKPLPAFVQAVGDFNHDGKLDFATSQFGSNPVSVYLGNGDGTFQPKKTFSGPSDSIGSLLAVDLNHDSKTDLVEVLSDIGTSVSAIVQLWISNGDGTFTKGQSFVASTGVVANQYTGGAVTGDFDGDGKPDIALIYGYAIDQQEAQTVPVASTVRILYGDGAGHLGSPIYFADPKHTFDSAPFAADLNNDGRSDIVAVASPPTEGVTINGTFAVFLGNSNRTLSYKTLTNSACAGPDGTGISVADLNGDGLTTWPTRLFRATATRYRPASSSV